MRTKLFSKLIVNLVIASLVHSQFYLGYGYAQVNEQNITPNTTPSKNLLPKSTKASLGTTVIDPHAIETDLTADEAKRLYIDTQITFWATIQEHFPQHFEFIFGQDTQFHFPIATNDPLLDEDPFFLRSQKWISTSSSSKINCDNTDGANSDHFCFRETAQGIEIVSTAFQEKQLQLFLPLTAVWQTEQYLFLLARDSSLFDQKLGNPLPNSSNNSEPKNHQGIFFINKGDFWLHAQRGYQVPIYFFPLPGDGWIAQPSVTGKGPIVAGLEGIVEMVAYNAEGEPLPIELEDIQTIEKIQRTNLFLTQVATLLELGSDQFDRWVLPPPKSTMGFGMICAPREVNVRFPKFPQQSYLHKNKKDHFINDLLLSSWIKWLPRVGLSQALASQKDSQSPSAGSSYSRLTRLKQFLRDWSPNILLYGSYSALALYLFNPNSFQTLIPENYQVILTHIGILMAGIIGTSVVLKYTVFKEHFQSLYPNKPGDSLLTKIHNEHKGIIESIGYGLFFSFLFPNMLLRHMGEYGIHRYFSMNNIVRKIWDHTFGYVQNMFERIRFDYRQIYLGWLHGLLDSAMVFVTIFVFAPYLANKFGIGVASGSYVAAFAFAELLRNLVLYFQTGPYYYAEQLHEVVYHEAIKRARQQLTLDGKNPDDPHNKTDLVKAIDREMKRIHKLWGFPPENVFLYDAYSVLRKLARGAAGFKGPQLLEAEANGTDSNQKFLFESKEWGLAIPMLTSAVHLAEDLYRKHPSPTGKQVLELLRWARTHYSQTQAVFERIWDGLASKWGSEEFMKSLNLELAIHQMEQAEFERALAQLSPPDRIQVKKELVRLGKKPRPKIQAIIRAIYRFFKEKGVYRDWLDLRAILTMASYTDPELPFALHVLPKSWIERAGSKEAAWFALELLHHSFRAHWAGNPRMLDFESLNKEDLRKAEQLVKRYYGVRTQSAQISDGNHFQDEYSQAILMYRWALKIQERKDRLERIRQIAQNPLPPEDWLARRQWNQIFKKASPKMSPVASRSSDTGNSTDVGINSPTDQLDLNLNQFPKEQQFMIISAWLMAEKNGLRLLDPQQSEIMRAVLEKALLTFQAQKELPEFNTYLQNLDPAEQEKSLAKLFYDHLIKALYDKTIQDENVRTTRAEVPGRWQKVRRALVFSHHPTLVRIINLVLEPWFRTGPDLHRPGWQGLIGRSIPLYSDLKQAAIRVSRQVLNDITVLYATMAHIWLIQAPYLIWVLSRSIFRVTFQMYMELNNRLMRWLDIKPLENARNKMVYTFVHSNLTNTDLIILNNFANDFRTFFEKSVEQIKSSLITGIKSSAEFCGRIFGGDGH
ncbi:MAG: hypothetical protein RMK80_05530 [Pseudobdellovibrionaceae bacterium]|nr:hypothetical protein [Pseudobdellovibrionaceae bacterium]